MASGTVVRFDRRRGYGFVAPDDGGEDVFVHQNNINMEGFRFLQVGERVTYELEVGEKGMKAVGVALTEPRAPQANGGRDDFGGRDGGMGDDGGDGYRQRAPMRERPARPARPARGDDAGAGAGAGADKLRRKLERLVSLLVEKGVLAPGELDGLEGSAPAAKTSESAEA